jgi:hypothetical protein
MINLDLSLGPLGDECDTLAGLYELRASYSNDWEITKNFIIILILILIIQ